MKCPFCGVENPAHANFCMNCGSPQDLKACEECGGINRKSATVCEMCSAPFGQQPAVTESVAAAPQLATHVAQAEALAKETLTFKKLFAEIERDVHRQLTPQKSALSTDPARIAEHVAGASLSAPIVVEAPSYLEEMLSARTGAKRKSANWWVVLVVFLLLVFGGIGYFMIGENEATLAILRSLTEKPVPAGTQSAGHISPPATASDNKPAPRR